MKPIKLNHLLRLVDDHQNIDIFYNEKMLWSGLKKDFLDVTLGNCFVDSINIEKATYPVLEIYMLGYTEYE